MLEWFGKRRRVVLWLSYFLGWFVSNAGMISLDLRKELVKYADKPFSGKGWEINGLPTPC